MTSDSGKDAESLEVIDLGSEVDQPPPRRSRLSSSALSRRRLFVGAIGVVALVAVGVVAKGGEEHRTLKATVSSACAKAMATMAHEPSTAMDATTATDEVSTVVACRSPSEWYAAAARYMDTEAHHSPGGAPGSGYAPVLSLAQFCIQARGIPTPTCDSS